VHRDHRWSGGEQWQVLVEGDIANMPYRGYADGLGDGYILEIKTVHPLEFRRAALRNYWDLQGALYMNATDAQEVRYLALDPKAPHAYQFFTMSRDSQDYANAMRIAQKALLAFQDCQANPAKWQQGPEYWDGFLAGVPTNFNRYMPEDE